MKHLIFILLTLPLFLSAQNENTDRQRAIIGIAAYRNELIARNPEGFKKISLMNDIWHTESPEWLGTYMLGIITGSKIYGLTPEQIIKKFNKKYPKFKLKHLLNEEIIETIIENDELISLMQAQILQKDPPFDMSPDANIFNELDFYGVKNGMKVAEIGAGNGLFCLLLGLTYDSLTIYMNDVDENAVEYGIGNMNNCTTVFGNNQFLGVVGKKKSTNMEPVRLDKVIIRNSFHHFSHQAAMLYSIRKSLIPDGDLYIADPTIQPGKKSSCSKAMRLEAIREVVNANGFEIMEERPIEGWTWVLLHCQPVE